MWPASYTQLGYLARFTGDFDNALIWNRKALAFQERIVQQRPADPQTQRELAQKHVAMGQTCLARGVLAEAQTHFEFGQKELQGLLDADAQPKAVLSDLSFCTMQLALLAEMRSDAAAASTVRRRHGSNAFHHGRARSGSIIIMRRSPMA